MIYLLTELRPSNFYNDQGYELSIQTGDLVTASYCAAFIITDRFYQVRLSCIPHETQLINSQGIGIGGNPANLQAILGIFKNIPSGHAQLHPCCHGSFPSLVRSE